MKLKAIKQIKGERVIVSKVDKERTSSGGIVIAESNDKQRDKGVVVKIIDSKVKDLKPGMLVLCSKRAGVYFDDIYFVLNTDDILCEVCDD